MLFGSEASSLYNRDFFSSFCLPGWEEYALSCAVYVEHYILRMLLRVMLDASSNVITAFHQTTDFLMKTFWFSRHDWLSLWELMFHLLNILHVWRFLYHGHQRIRCRQWFCMLFCLTEHSDTLPVCWTLSRAYFKISFIKKLKLEISFWYLSMISHYYLHCAAILYSTHIAQVALLLWRWNCSAFKFQFQL